MQFKNATSDETVTSLSVSVDGGGRVLDRRDLDIRPGETVDFSNVDSRYFYRMEVHSLYHINEVGQVPWDGLVTLTEDGRLIVSSGGAPRSLA